MRVGPRSTQTHTEIHLIQVHPEINLHKEYTYLCSPGVRPSVFSFGPPLPYPKRHFCNSMQASELCQKVLVSLKADLSFKVGASSMGSTFPSAGSRNENFFTCTCGGRFQCSHASMKPLSQFIQCKGQAREQFYNMILVLCVCFLSQKAIQSRLDDSGAPAADELRLCGSPGELVSVLHQQCVNSLL